MPVIDWDLVQGSQQWYAARSGIPTASCAHLILTPKKLQISEQRKSYACRLIAERLLNWQADSLDKIQHIADGKAGEPFAVAQLEEVYDIETKRVGFIRTSDGRFGASPDRVVCANGSGGIGAISTTVEIKCPTIPVQIERLIFGNDEAYLLQRQMQLWVAEADKSLYYSWSDRMPAFTSEEGRSEAVIAKLVAALDQFSDELEEWTEVAKRSGAFQAFPALLPPIDAERGGDTQWDEAPPAVQYTGRYAPPSDKDIDDIVNGRW